MFEYLKGKKTYLLLAAAAAMHTFADGIMDPNVDYLQLLEYSALAALRAGVAKS